MRVNEKKNNERVLTFEKDGYMIYDNESNCYHDEDFCGVDSIEEAYIYDDIECAKNEIEDCDNAYCLEIHKVRRLFTIESILKREIVYNEELVNKTVSSN